MKRMLCSFFSNFFVNNYWDSVSPYCIHVRITSTDFTVIMPKISRASGINGSVD